MSIGLAKLMKRRIFWSAAIQRLRDRFQSSPPRIGPVANADMSPRAKAHGFTLLEIMMAVTILGMMSIAIFRFVQTSLTALQFSSYTEAADAQYDGLRELLTTQWQDLSPLRAKMFGEPFKQNDRERDEIRWNCGAGPGLLTRYAAGEFTAVLRLQPANNNTLDLGIVRKQQEDSDVAEGHESWVPLIKNVGSLEISYFDVNANDWLPRWPGGNRMPSLIRVRVGRPDAVEPWEAVIPLRRTPY